MSNGGVFVAPRLSLGVQTVRPLGSNVVDSKIVCICFVPHVTAKGAFIVVWSAGRSINTLPQTVGAVCAASASSSTSAFLLNLYYWIDDVWQSAKTSVVHDFTGAAGADTASAASCWGSPSGSWLWRSGGHDFTSLRLEQALFKLRALSWGCGLSELKGRGYRRSRYFWHLRRLVCTRRWQFRLQSH